MARWVIILAVTAATWVGLTVYTQGVDQTFGGVLARLAIPSWEPAARHPNSDRTEDAFQRAWNKSEERAQRALKKEAPEDQPSGP